MNQITEEQIEQALDYFQDLSDKESKKVMRKLQKEQEPLLVFISALVEREELNEYEQDLLISSVLVLWKLTSEASSGQKMITIEELQGLDTKIGDELEEALNFTEDQLQQAAMASVTRLQEFNQPAFVDLLLREIVEAPEDSGIREEMKGILFSYTAGVMESLLKASA